MAQLIVNPATGSVSPCDGYARRAGVDQTFAALIASSANSDGFNSATTNTVSFVQASTTTDQFQQLIRMGFNFDTSALTDQATITSATFSLYITGKSNALGSDSYTVVSLTPSSTSTFRTTEYAQLGATAFCTPVSYASITTNQYTDFVLNASGLAQISKTGISSFGLRSEWDRSGVFGGVWASNASANITVNFADATNKPKLTIEYTLPSGMKTFSDEGLVS